MVTTLLFPNRDLTLATSLYQSSHWGACLKVLDRIKLSDPDQAFLQKNVFKIQIRIHLRRKDWRKAQSTGLVACQKFPVDPTLNFLLGLAYFLQGKSGMNQAHSCFSKVHEIAPRWGTNLKRLAQTYRLVGQVDDSILVLRKMVSQKPNCPKSLHLLILALRQIANQQEANNLVRQARFLFPYCSKLSTLYQTLQNPKARLKATGPRLIPFVRLFASTQSPTNQGIVLRIEDHPKSKIMRAFAPTGLRRS